MSEPQEPVPAPAPQEPIPFPVPDPPEPEVPLAIEDLLNDLVLVQQKETADRALLEGISTLSLRPTLVVWAAQGFPAAWTVQEIRIQPPTRCSDGVERDLADYIAFVSGKTIGEHTAALQARLSGIVVSYAWTGQSILIVVSKA